MTGLTGDDARAAENKTTLEAKLKAYEAILSKQKYLAGDVSNYPSNLLLPLFYAGLLFPLY